MLPVFCGQRLLVSHLRPAYRDAAYHAGAILALLVRHLRQAWPEVKLVFRGDSGFSRLEALSLDIRYKSAIRWEAERTKQRHFGRIDYAAHSWKRPRRKVVVKAEISLRGFHTRYVVTNLHGSPQWLYDSRYCLRGDMENRIKDQHRLFSDRTSCYDWWPNQYRLLLAGLAYLLLERLRQVYLKRAVYAAAQVTTMRLRLLKIGGVVIRNTRHVWLMLSSHYPDQDSFRKLVPG